MSKFIDFIHKTGDEDDDYENEYDVDEEMDEDEGYEDEKPRRNAIFNVFGKNKGGVDRDLDDDDDGYDDDYEAPKRQQVAPKVSQIRTNTLSRKAGNSNMNNNSNMEVIVVKPTVVDDAYQIADALLAERSVVLNLEGLDITVATHIFDITLGILYSLKGKVEQISKFVYVITPSSVFISGDTNSEDNSVMGKNFTDR